MIKARDLRIGNWVQVSSGIGKVRSFDPVDDGFQGVVSNDDDSVWERVDINDNCNPITLTEEWLLRFGVHIDGISIQLKSGTIGVIQRNRGGLFKYYLQGAFGMVHLDSIQYVHKLQNLYFVLTGQELIINQ